MSSRKPIDIARGILSTKNYGISALYRADVLTRFQFLKDHPLVEELVQWLIDSPDDTGRFKPTSIFMGYNDSPDDTGRFKPTSIFMGYKDWEFSNKQMSSRWITFLCGRILKRYYSELNLTK